MKRMRDYSKWTLDRLRAQARYHRDVIDRLEKQRFPCSANRKVLAEIERQIALKTGGEG